MIYNPNRALFKVLLSCSLLMILVVYSASIYQQHVEVNLLLGQQPPSRQYWFGTDQLGRDFWLRCFQSVITSLYVGVGAAMISGVLALLFASLCLVNNLVDSAVGILINTLLALPHLLLLLLISFCLGAGKQGVIWAIALTHWPKLALILRAELQRISRTDYVMLSHRIGDPPLLRWRRHFLPLLTPQWFVGILLMFPHAILHSAALSFIGFGLTADQFSLGSLLTHSLRYLSEDAWWLVLFPGMLLVLLVLLVDSLARALQQLWLRSGDHAAI